MHDVGGCTRTLDTRDEKRVTVKFACLAIFQECVFVYDLFSKSLHSGWAKFYTLQAPPSLLDGVASRA